MMKRLILVCVVVAMFGDLARGQVMRLDGTSRGTFKVAATSASPLSLTNNSGSLSLSGGLDVTGGTIDFTGITITDLGLVTTADINGGSIDGTAIGAATRAAGSFTTLAANAGLTVSGGSIDFSGASIGALGTVSSMDLNGGTIDGTPIGDTTPASGDFTALSASNGLVVYNGLTVNTGATTFGTADINGGAIDSTTIGSSIPAAGSFPTLAVSGAMDFGSISTSGQITSTLASGTSPLVVASDTKVLNLNVDKVDGFTFAGGSQKAMPYLGSGSVVLWTSAGASGQMLWKDSSNNPTWVGLDSAKIWIGNTTDQALPQAVSGDVTMNWAGEFTLTNGSVSEQKLSASLGDLVLSATLTAGTEVSNTISCELQVRDVYGLVQHETYMTHWNLADADMSAGETSQSVTVSYDDGGEWQQITANKKAVAFTDSDGRLTLDVTHTGANTLYLMCEFRGTVYSVPLVFA